MMHRRFVVATGSPAARNPGSTAGRGFNPTGGAPGGGYSPAGLLAPADLSSSADHEWPTAELICVAKSQTAKLATQLLYFDHLLIFDQQGHFDQQLTF
ncbi:hypothetical protein F511_25846 [Dorcoceras hygrometricum]|uniref:Uncharacterized protein n=1 Tax=Dorcoceras hygrometricum TaxID=472368 RepID=A0A2Z7B2I5_9LAMI|nr:hypothetical protein F511_25846 [Dorcoceras hygrometricum]